MGISARSLVHTPHHTKVNEGDEGYEGSLTPLLSFIQKENLKLTTNDVCATPSLPSYPSLPSCVVEYERRTSGTASKLSLGLRRDVLAPINRQNARNALNGLHDLLEV